MLRITQYNAAQRMGAEVGLTPERCVQLIKANDPKWQAFRDSHAIQIVANARESNNIALAPEQGLQELMHLNWQTIEGAQQRINTMINNGRNLSSFKQLCGGLKDLQGTYLQLCKIKKMDDEHRGNAISRFTVESILQSMFPRLKTAIHELSTAIKHELPIEQRASYEAAFRKALPNYNAIITESIEKLNAILEASKQEFADADDTDDDADDDDTNNDDTAE